MKRKNDSAVPLALPSILRAHPWGAELATAAGLHCSPAPA